MPQEKYLAGGLQSGCTANSTGVQYNNEIMRKVAKFWFRLVRVRNCRQTLPWEQLPWHGL